VIARRARRAPQKRGSARSRAESVALNAKFYGKEPSVEATMSESHIGAALNWYSMTCDVEHARAFLDSALDKARAERMRAVPDDWVPRTAAWLLRLRDRGVLLPSRMLDRAAGWVEEALSKERRAAVARRPLQAGKPSSAAREAAAMIEGRLDDCEETRASELIGTSRATAQYLLEKYSPQLDELERALTSSDEEDVFQFRGYSADDIVGHLEKLRSVVEAAKTALAAPRERPPESIERRAKRLRWSRRDEESGVDGASSMALLGSVEAWVYDPRRNVVSVFRAAKPSGLDSRGTSIFEFDVETSKAYSLGRKKTRADTVRAISTAPKGTLKKIAAGLKETRLSPRTNSESVFIRVIKRTRS